MRCCAGKDKTLTLIRTAANYTCAGYTSVAWNSGVGSQEDKNARLFALTGDPKVFKPRHPEKAVYHGDLYGPCFQQALCLWYTLNDKNCGSCYANGAFDLGGYFIPTSNGVNVLTGQGAGQQDHEMEFTCRALEVFHVFD